jgi:four helix bundle suffix protein
LSVLEKWCIFAIDNREEIMGKANKMFLPQDGRYDDLIVYRKSECICDVTDYFCKTYMDRRADRTVDQMVQAARSGKQNIVEGTAASATSQETEIKLLNVAKASHQELLEDYQDYLKRKGLSEWFGRNDRFDRLHQFCRYHSQWADYQPMMVKMNDEELANMAICLCHQVDKALAKYIELKDREFTTEGGIRERMTAARLGQRETQRQTIERLTAEINALRQENARLKQIMAENGIK